MAAAPIIEEGIAPILEHVAPDLRLVPDWAPPADPAVPMGPLGKTIHWSDVFDWVKDETRNLLPAGRDITEPLLLDAQAHTETMVGEAMKAMSGFIDQNAAMTVQAAQLLESAIDNARAQQLHDFAEHEQAIQRLQAHNDYVDQYVVPNLQAQVLHAEAFAYSVAVAAQQNAQQWSIDHIFSPVYSELLKVQPAIDAGVQKAENVAHSELHNSEVAQAVKWAADLAPLALAQKALKSWQDDCGEPMCESIGPKTDLGKLLKALKIATDLALFAELANLDSGKLAALIRQLTSHVAGIIDDFESMFVEGGQTLGHVVTAALP